jgi:Tol biopolymer transport system component
VSFAPDGKHLVFAKETDTSKNDIFIVDTDGSDVRRVTNTPAPDSAADWGPPA